MRHRLTLPVSWQKINTRISKEVEKLELLMEKANGIAAVEKSAIFSKIKQLLHSPAVPLLGIHPR